MIIPQAIKNNARQALATLIRFPLPLLSAFFAGGLSLYALSHELPQSLQVSIRTGILGAILLLATGLLAAGFGKKSVCRYALPVAALLLLGMYDAKLSAQLAFTDVDQTLYTLLLLASSLFVSLAPFRRFWLQEPAFWVFNQVLFTRLMITLSYSLALLIGFALAMEALSSLFNISFDQNNYSQVGILLGFYFAPWFFIAGMPADPTQLNKPENPPKYLIFFIKYLLLPFVFLFAAILYLYALKIIAQWKMPQGQVVSLVLGLSILAISVYLLLYAWQKDIKNTWIAIYNRFFPLVLLPLCGLLFLSIYQRTMQYGITENRYFIWMAALAISSFLLYISIKKQVNLKLLALGLGVLCCLASFGPQSVFSVSTSSQVQRLEQLLTKYGLLADKQLTAQTINLPAVEIKEIKSVLFYLIKTKRLEQLTAWGMHIPNPNMRFDSLQNQLLTQLKLNKLETGQQSIHITKAAPKNALLIGNYRALISSVQLTKIARKETSMRHTFKYLDNELQLFLDEKGTYLNFSWNKNPVESIELQGLLNTFVALSEKHPNARRSLSDEHFTILFRNGTMRLIFENMQLKKVDSCYQIEAATGYLLLK